MTNDMTAEMMRAMNPARVERWAFSDLNPWMGWIKAMADSTRKGRQPVSKDNPLVKFEHEAARRIVQALDQYRDTRDGFEERLFKMIYESPFLAAMVGIDRRTLTRPGARPPTWEQEELRLLKLKEVEASIDEGTVADAWARLLLYVRPSASAADERSFNMIKRMIEESKTGKCPSMATLREAVRRQARVLALDEERAIAALPKLAPDQLHQQQLDVARKVMRTRGELTPQQEERFRRLSDILTINGTAQA
jgi:hypothetical protein